jgi:tetratricopeptide (TPR) repeat protein
LNRKNKLHILIALVALLFTGACSTQRNTWLSRNYQTLTARYNVYYNGNEAFIKGTKKIETALVDDYSQILPMFYYSVHDNLKLARSDMDRSIEKSKKLIKKHSIRRKPKFNAAKARNESYLEWFRREEFNPMVDDAYMMLGKAHFFKGEFLESIGVFNYITRHFSTQFVKYEAQLWMARAYAEMDWLYEAEDVLKKANDDDFPFQLAGDFAAITADIHLKRGDYKEAIPYLREALAATKEKSQRRRYQYILAQLYQESENYENAVAAYNEVLRMSPPYDMEFNARIKLTEVFQGRGNADGILKELRKMLKDDKNKEYLDQIYYAMGNIEMTRKNKEKAIEFYKLSIEKSTRNAIQKGLSNITLAEMYLQAGEYRKAQPYFAGAAAAFGPEYPGAQRIKDLAGVLNEMAAHFETIELQDSLQRVAALSPEQQDNLISKIIDDVVESERIAEKEAARNTETVMPPGISDWYFYNRQLVLSGKDDFRSQWGNRKLEDNWRRARKVSNSFGMLAGVDEGEEKTEVLVTDNMSKEYYLQNIPETEEDFEASNKKMDDALYGLAEIFRNNLKDNDEALYYYNRSLDRFPQSANRLNALFGAYMAAQKSAEGVDSQGEYKGKIIEEFPNSKYATILSDPDYLSKLQKSKAIQDSVYQAAYKAYMSGDFAEVSKGYSDFIQKYPDSELMPNFRFLNALIVGSTDSVAVFKDELEQIRKDYPTKSVAEQAQIILAQLEEGKVPSGSKTTMGGLLAKRSALLEELGMEQFEDTLVAQNGAKELFVNDASLRHYFVMLIPSGKVNKEQFLYEVARFNFTKFMISDFDLSWVNYNADTTMMIVNGFNSLEESLWYQRTFILEPSLYEILKVIPYERMVISDRNFRALVTTRRLKKYNEFYDGSIRRLEGTIKDPSESTAIQNRQ